MKTPLRPRPTETHRRSTHRTFTIMSICECGFSEIPTTSIPEILLSVIEREGTIVADSDRDEGRILNMLKHHEIQLLRRASHNAGQVCRICRRVAPT